MSVPASHYADTGGVRKTRFKELGYVKSGTPGNWFWQHVDFNPDGTVSQVGRQYPSEKQLLADHERYAWFYGCEGSDRPAQLSWQEEMISAVKKLTVLIENPPDTHNGRDAMVDAIILEMLPVPEGREMLRHLVSELMKVI